MATETLRPNAAGAETNLAIGGSSPAATNWESVDEAIADDGITDVHCAGGMVGATKCDLYNIADSGVGSGTINKITVHIRSKTLLKADSHQHITIKSNSTVTEGTQKDWVADNTFEDFSQEWALNPADSEAWEWADIDALQIGITITCGEEVDAYCTQVYVVVDYTYIPQVVIIG